MGFTSSQQSFHHPSGVSIMPEGFPATQRGFHHPSRICIIPKDFSPSSRRGFHGPTVLSSIPMGFLSSRGVSTLPPLFPSSRRAPARSVQPQEGAVSPGCSRRTPLHPPGSEDFKDLLEIQRGFKISAGNSASSAHPGEGKQLGDFGGEMWRLLVARGTIFSGCF